MSELEAFVVQTARGLYRWERESGWVEQCGALCDFEEGDAVTIAPFTDQTSGSMALWPIFGEFREYVTEDIVKVYIPEKSDDGPPVWFDGEAGEYLIHEGYLTPQ